MRRIRPLPSAAKGAGVTNFGINPAIIAGIVKGKWRDQTATMH